MAKITIKYEDGREKVVEATHFVVFGVEGKEVDTVSSFSPEALVELSKSNAWNVFTYNLNHSVNRYEDLDNVAKRIYNAYEGLLRKEGKEE